MTRSAKVKDPIRELERAAQRRDDDVLHAADAYEIAHSAGEASTRKLLEELRETARERRAAHGRVAEARAKRADRERAEREARAAAAAGDEELTTSLAACGIPAEDAAS